MLKALVIRNSKLFFKDKGMFFTSLITPAILLVLYISFLSDVYSDAFSQIIPEGLANGQKLINSAVASQMLSSILSVSCVTVSFCSNLLMVNDKVNGSRKDFMMTPVRSSVLSLGYFISSAFVTLIVCFTALAACLVYVGIVGWYFTVSDILLLMLDTVILVLFGTSLSSLVNCWLNSNGQASAVGTIVSSGYGFISGAYMPISNLGDGLQKVLSFLPGTYGTSLMRNHSLRGVYEAMTNEGFPEESIDAIRDVVDCNVYFFGEQVSVAAMYAIVIGATVLIGGAYVLVCKARKFQ